MEVRTKITERLHRAAERIAEQKGISFAAAYEQLLRQHPRAYEMILAERADAGAPGSSGAIAYVEAVRRLGTPGR